MEEDLDALRDISARVRILRRIGRMEMGNFGDHKSLGGGLWELRIDHGPGYRLYYCLQGKRVVLLFCAGDKSSQKADIKRALLYKQDNERKKSHV